MPAPRPLLALLATGLLLAGHEVPALAQTPPNARAFKDVSPSSWAYGAVVALAEKYHVMGGFPDGTFRGNAPVTRYQLAVILSKVMDKVITMIAAATGTTAGASGAAAVSPDDLATIQRLQQEFSDELTLMRERQDALDSRLTAEEQHPRIGVGVSAFTRGYPTNAGVATPNTYRVMTDLTLDATLSSAVSYTGWLSIYNQGVYRFANGHRAIGGDVPSGVSDAATPFYVRRSFFTVQPGNVYVKVGMFDFADAMPVGSTLKNEFVGPIPLWNEAQGGYGFVGTPPVASGSPALYPGGPGTPDPAYAGRAPWDAGLDPTQDLLDPDSDPSNTGSSPAVLVGGTMGPFELAVGANTGVPGANPAVALVDEPANFPLIAGPGAGYYLAKAAMDLGWMRASAYYHNDMAAVVGGSNPSGKGAGAVLDLGSDALGLSFSYAEVSRLAVGAPLGTTDGGYFQEGGAFLVSNDFLSTGMDFGAGTKFGFIPDGSPFATGFLSAVLNENWTSTGAYVRVPGFSVVPHVTLAAQESGTDFLTDNYGAGLSAIAEVQVAPQFPLLLVEYDQGRFGADNNLFSGTSKPTHEQVLVGTTMKF